MSRYYRSFLEESGAVYSYLFDSVPNSNVAYSLRKLKSTYNGNAIRVRRSSDNSEQNIAFTNNLLDTASLLSFVGASNGFVTTFFDQIGSNNLVQTTASSQPQIIASGALITQSGKPSIKWSTVQTMLMTSNLTGLVNASYSIFMDYYKGGSGNNAISLHDGGSYAWLDWSSTQYMNTSSITATFPNLEHKITNAILVNNISSKIYANGVQLGSTGNGINSNPLTISSFFSTLASRVESHCSEIIFYNSNQTTNRTLIETNQNNYYGIY